MICRRFVPKITNHREHFASILAKSGGLSFVATPGSYNTRAVTLSRQLSATRT